MKIHKDFHARDIVELCLLEPTFRVLGTICLVDIYFPKAFQTELRMLVQTYFL